MLDVEPVLLDQAVDALGTLAGVGAGIGNGAAEPDIVPYVVDPVGVLEQIVDVSQTNAKTPVDVPSLVRSVPFRHLLLASE
jgi:hypothetical protein